MKTRKSFFLKTCLACCAALLGAAAALAAPPQTAEWARVTEDDRAIKIKTDKLEAVIPKKEPKQWMTGIEKGSFLDKATGFREVGDGSPAQRQVHAAAKKQFPIN